MRAALPNTAPSIPFCSPRRQWWSRRESLQGRPAIIDYLPRKWDRELDYRMCKELCVSGFSRIAVRFAAEWHDDAGRWFRSHGSENWDCDERGIMRLRYALVDDLPIVAADRKFLWDRSNPRPTGHPGLTDLGL
jgi:nuclear transport factor 2 (NTF2) superfamily protein